MLLQNNGDLQVKLMDFGLIRQTNASMQLTQEGVALGTVAYMAPEQAQGIPVDFRADLYALGAIMYEMATGRPPFVHDNPAMILMQQLTTTPPVPRQLNPNIDEPLENLILDLLAKEPSKRPASTGEVAARLAHLADESAPAISLQPHRVDRIPRVPLIGRAESLEKLMQLWRKAAAGEGQVVLISGVAGSGKTRLLNELSTQVKLDNGRFLRVNCLEHGALPYEPIPEVLNTLLKDLPPSVRESIPPELAQILSPDYQATPSTTSDQNPAEARARLYAGCWEILRLSAEKQPLLLAIEDTQWVDPTSLEMRLYLARHMSQAPIMMVGTLRPEEADPKSNVSSAFDSLIREQIVHPIHLDLLNKKQVTDFLKVALGQTEIADWMVDTFYQATDGNPLFIEETLKALAAEGQVSNWINKSRSSQSTHVSTMTLQLPQNVLTLAERRLQLLSDEDRPVLTAAAVIGPEFPFALLEGVTKLDEDSLLDAIDRLLAARLIQELPLLHGEDRYRFSQEALRQAVLKQVSGRRRRSLHRRAGEMMLAYYEDDQPRYWPILAHHFAEAGNVKLAFKYYIRTGDAAAHMYANAEAIAYYSRALELLTGSDTATAEVASREQISELFTKRGRSLELNGQFEEALDNYIEMESLAKTLDDRNLALAALLAQATIQATPTNVANTEQARKVADKALTLSRDLGDRQAEAKALWNLMLASKNKEQTQEAIAYGEQSLAIARELNLREQMAYTLNDISWAYLLTRQADKSQAALSEACELWRELENIPMLADNLNSSASQYAMQGQLELAFTLAKEAASIGEPINNWWSLTHSHSLLGIIHTEYSEFANALEHFERAIDYANQGNIAHMQFATYAELGWVYGQLGDIERGLELVREAQTKSHELMPGWQATPLAMGVRLHLLNDDIEAALALVDQHPDMLNIESVMAYDGIWVGLSQAELALKQQAYDKAIAAADQVIEGLNLLNLKAYLADGLHLKGEALRYLGQVDAARTVLAEGRDMAEATNDRRILWPILFTLSQLERQQGNTAEAESLHQKACELISYIADHAPAELRESFLGSSRVKEVLG